LAAGWSGVKRIRPGKTRAWCRELPERSVVGAAAAVLRKVGQTGGRRANSAARNMVVCHVWAAAWRAKR
jgi:hypothetical protein